MLGPKWSHTAEPYVKEAWLDPVFQGFSGFYMDLNRNWGGKWVSLDEGAEGGTRIYTCTEDHLNLKAWVD